MWWSVEDVTPRIVKNASKRSMESSQKQIESERYQSSPRDQSKDQIFKEHIKEIVVFVKTRRRDRHWNRTRTDHTINGREDQIEIKNPRGIVDLGSRLLDPHLRRLPRVSLLK